MGKKKERSQADGTVPHKFYLNGEPVTVIPPEAQEKMAERLSRVVSQHFSQHPEEYEAFLKCREEKRIEKTV